MLMFIVAPSSIDSGTPTSMVSHANLNGIASSSVIAIIMLKASLIQLVKQLVTFKTHRVDFIGA